MGDYGFHKLVSRDDEYALKLKENFKHFVNLQKIIESYKDKIPGRGCGSYLSYNNPHVPGGCDYDVEYYTPEFYDKQKRLYLLAKKVNHVLEIGVNTGHSIFIMLLANPNIQVLGVDICGTDVPYIEDCVKYLNDNFNNRITLIKGDSTKVLPSLRNLFKQFDLIHIDGFHDFIHVSKDIRYSYMLGKDNCYFVIDDFIGEIQMAVDEYVVLNYLEPIEISIGHNSVFRKR